MKTYEVTIHRVVEHETVYRVKASNEDEAEKLVMSGYYDEITHDWEEGEIEDPEIVDVVEI